jgi:HD-like signal output (HDOD) protein
VFTRGMTTYDLESVTVTADQAVVLLGFEEVHRLVVTASLINLRSLFEGDAHLVVYRQIMRHSIATALFARLLAEELNLPRGEMAYTAGLLHAVGRLVLLYNVPETYEALWGSSGDRQVPSAEDERAIFGTDYASLGAAGAEHWNLSSDLRDLIRHHPEPDRLAQEIPVEDEERADLIPLVRALRAARDLGVPYARILDEEVEEEDLEVPESLGRLLEHRFTSTDQLMNRVTERREEIGQFVRMVLQQS